MRYQEQDPEKVREHLEKIKELQKNGVPIVHIDETGIDTFIYREYDYAPKGEIVIGKVRGRKYQRMGVVSSLLDGKPIAPFIYTGTMDSQLFEWWFSEYLLPALPTNAVIIMDNAAFHRKTQLYATSEASSHSLIFLPPYSPDINPIENFWWWLKQKLKKILPSFHSLWDAISYIFQVI